MNWVSSFLAMLCGVVFTTQIGNNAQLSKFLGTPYIPAAVNMMVGVIASCAAVLIAHKPWPQAANAAAAPWWMWIAGGLLGTGFTGSLLIEPGLGAAALVAYAVTGQLLFAVLCDHYGWLGFQQRNATVWRGLGCALMVGGVALVGMF